MTILTGNLLHLKSRKVHIKDNWTLATCGFVTLSGVEVHPNFNDLAEAGFDSAQPDGLFNISNL